MELKDTLLMPKTSFEMRGNLTQKEPLCLKRWDELGLYERMNENREGCEEFLLHDGPPYANGNIHCGHMMNRLLKDFLIRYKNMAGYKTPFVFGWDTHGLPIEVQLTKGGVDRKAMSVAAFRDLCKEYALKQVANQKSQVKRLGCLGDYERPYLTLDPAYEAHEIDVFAAMALKGLIYKGVKPVYWSPSSESALAEAEVEYKDVPARTLYVAFDFADGKGIVPSDAKILIWTTTPWTVPADLAVTLNPLFKYGLFDTDKGQLVFLSSLKGKLVATLGLKKCDLIKEFKGKDLEMATVRHPLYDRLSTVICANFVTDEDGTGCVHTAPDHGVDDFNACLKYGIKPFCPVDEKGYLHLEKGDPCDGKFYAEANDIVVDELARNGHLLKEVDIVHSYPHDWRTHKPVIFRATPQWFCSIAPIRGRLLEEVRKIKWRPAWGETKMVNMIKDRADWCISRQRAWGVPIPIIYNEDGTPILEKRVFERISALVREKGSNVWFESQPKDLLPAGYANPASPNGGFRKETDIMDVWFDSGSSWNGVLRERGLSYPADLYFEGNDQYRGWFNASLILSVAYSGFAPFKECLTHGWVMDDAWQKMSKSAGNGIDPSKVANQFGADVLRLWAASINYQTDVRISESIVRNVSEQYRKIRNTFRFMLGNLQDGEKAYVQPKEKPRLEAIDEWTLAEWESVKNGVLKDYENCDFAGVNMALAGYLVDLSGFYLDVGKDSLYCDAADSPRRKAFQYVIFKIAYEMCLLYNPILSFTMDEVYHAIPGMGKASPQLEDMPRETHEYDGTGAREDYASFRRFRDLALKALEEARAEGRIGSSSEASLHIVIGDGATKAVLAKIGKDELRRTLIVADLSLSEGSSGRIEVRKTANRMCSRCRAYRDDVAEMADGAKLCSRCQAVLKGKM
ncbi:MAG: isoleucine--tRNA ligase [Bacilli bacterium]|jgi:isoleucyl-tRNA synthetase|nr:isoleucine--tRNA ligase [Bacilli bacterium]